VRTPSESRQPRTSNVSKWDIPSGSSPSSSTIPGPSRPRRLSSENLDKWRVSPGPSNHSVPSNKWTDIKTTVVKSAPNLHATPAATSQASTEKRRMFEQTMHSDRPVTDHSDPSRSKAARKFSADKAKTKGVNQRDSPDSARRRNRFDSYTSDVPNKKDRSSGTSLAAPKQKQTSPKLVQKTVPDVFIPSVVSVGNLAKLLSIRLGSSARFKRFTPYLIRCRPSTAQNGPSGNGSRVVL
jgi:hypothetical protein